MAVASICSMRYAVDCLLELGGTPFPDDSRLRDWDEIAALSWATPYPYLFEGFVHDAKGERDAAVSCYKSAYNNANISEES